MHTYRKRNCIMNEYCHSPMKWFRAISWFACSNAIFICDFYVLRLFFFSFFVIGNSLPKIVQSINCVSLIIRTLQMMRIFFQMNKCPNRFGQLLKRMNLGLFTVLLLIKLYISFRIWKKIEICLIERLLCLLSALLIKRRF